MPRPAWRDGRPRGAACAPPWGFGLAYGWSLAGALGSGPRLGYTVSGDTVTTASRRCAWAEGGEILVSESMREAFTRPQALGDRAPLTLRGKAEPVRVFRAVR